ncbi:MAG: hypothetical protein EOS28_30225 [Mesorhizobium sp.]|nr:MAG: hypothetical protein EOS28_30225 [Mesorhizobium sp.]
MTNDQNTVESAKSHLTKAGRDMRLLHSEVAKLTATIKGFTDKHPLPRYELPAGLKYHERAQTDEQPRSEIQQLSYEFMTGSDLDIPTRTILAMAKQLDRALRDVRAARNKVEAIADDSDLREDWKAWQKAKG